VKSYSSREIIRILEKDGWTLVWSRERHKQFRHPTKRGLVTVPDPMKDLDIEVLKSIERQSGIRFA
jgi:predicted RNA binding protein YcfA (HicA-like mRNA interferase family)